MLVQNEVVKELAKLIIERMPFEEDGNREHGYLNYVHANGSEVFLMGEAVFICFEEAERGDDGVRGENSGKWATLKICPTRGLAIASTDRANDVLEILLGELITYPKSVGSGANDSLIMYSSVFEVEQAKLHERLAREYTLESLDRELSQIWKRGDMDEQSDKHICWGLAALLNGHSWKCGSEEFQKPASGISEQDWNAVNNIWEYPQNARDHHGVEWFKALVKQSKYYSDIDWYINKFAEAEHSNHSKH